MRLSDVLPNFLFAASEIMRDYYLYTLHIEVVSRIIERLKNQDPQKSENIREVFKLHRMID